MLAATALAVASLGAIGVLGPLGSLIAGGQGTVYERTSDPSGRTGGDDAAIVADTSPVGPATDARGAATRASTRPRPVDRPSGGDAPSPSPGSGPQAPAPRPPGAPPAAPPPATPPTPPEPPAPPPRPPVVSAATDTLRTTAAQLPAPAKPAGDVLTELADTVDGTCGRLGVCP
jgi:hypothetical protein